MQLQRVKCSTTLLIYHSFLLSRISLSTSSSIFSYSHRDSFANVLDLLDDMFERASLADVSAACPFYVLTFRSGPHSSVFFLTPLYLSLFLSSSLPPSLLFLLLFLSILPFNYRNPRRWISSSCTQTSYGWRGWTGLTPDYSPIPLETSDPWYVPSIIPLFT